MNRDYARHGGYDAVALRILISVAKTAGFDSANRNHGCSPGIECSRQTRPIALAQPFYEGDVYIVTGPCVAPEEIYYHRGQSGYRAGTILQVVWDRTPPEKMIGFILANEANSKPHLASHSESTGNRDED